MKKSHGILTILSIAIASGAANAADGHIYANTVSAHNIAAAQHIILNNVINHGTQSAYINKSEATTVNKNYSGMYGHAPLYGPISEYGEYGDDGTVFTRGRNGGDDSWPIVSNVWLSWQHSAEDVKFKHYDKLDTDYDLLMIGAGGDRVKFAGGTSEFGAFAGFISSEQDNTEMNLDGKGGYFGVYNNYTNNEFNIAFVADAGVISNDANSAYGTDEYTNIWIGTGINASYKIKLDNTFALLPNIYGGYTWIKSGNYTSESSDKIKNQSFNMFEVTPGITAIKHIANGWFGTIGGKYIMTFANAGDLTVNDIAIKELRTNDYWEYGLSLEKSIERLAFSGNIYRHDGGRTGWNFGLSVKYTF